MTFNPELEDDSAEEFDDTDDGLDIEIEEVDDTPEADRGRPTVDFDPTDEEHSRDDKTFPETVQRRLNKMTLAINSERRAREERERQLSEAVDYARKVSKQLKEVRGQINVGERAYVKQVKTNVDIEMERAESDVQKAYEDGDAKKLASAHAKLATIAARKHAVDTYEPLVDLDDDAGDEIHDYIPSPQPTERPPLPKELNDWVARNSWFNTDEKKTAVALQISTELLNDGLISNSPRYFRELDAEITRRTSGTPPQRKTAPPVSSSRNSARAAPRKVTLTKAQLEVAKALGVTPQQYARELVKLES
jgi:hypothetical protein